jgi:SAM-dependent methyltransferase/NADP-dependent 3-hydroxy acid dehydrogenase YdfG/acyl carrier protein
MGRRTVTEAGTQWLPSLRKGRGDWQQLSETLAALYEASFELDWRSIDGASGRVVSIPSYPFQRERYWIDGTEESGRSERASSRERSTTDAVWATNNAYSVVWKPKALAPAAGDVGLGALSAPEALAGSLDQRLAATGGSADLATYDGTIRLLEHLATDYMVEALTTLAWRPQVGDVVRADELADALTVTRHHQPLLARMLAYLADDGVLDADGASYRVARELPAPATAHHRLALQGVAHAEHELALVTRCGQSLAAVLRGETPGVEVVFPRAATAVAEAVYTQSIPARVYNDLVRHAVQTMVSALPVDRKLRVLEVGAGTGSTSAAVLPILPAGRTRYVYTDVSPAFLQRAQEKFAAFDYVEYRTFDVERSGTAQGLDAGSFDLVIAANVLHATRDLKRTVSHIREMVADAGLVLFAEATAPRRWLDLTFGLTDGWWLFEDRELRAGQPLIARDAWLRLLASTGFEAAHAAPAAARADDTVAGNSLLIARATARPAPPVVADSTTWVVLVDGQGFGAHLAATVRARGVRCIEVRPGASTLEETADRWQVRAEDRRGFEQVFSPLRGHRLRIVDCWPLDVSSIDRASPAAFEDSAVLTCGGILHVTQSLASMGATARLWVVTREAMAVRDGAPPSGALQSTAWGFGRVVALEHPELWGGLVDIDAGDDVRMAERVLRTIDGDDGEDQVALRADGRHVARLAAAPAVETTPVTLRRDATYLITGGTGGVGLRVSREMARQGAGHLVLMSRSAADAATPEQLAAIRDIEAAGTRVTRWTGDVSRAADMDRLQAELPSWPPLRGVVHAASHIHTRRVADLELADVRAMLRPKVAGTWLLDQITGDAPLDFFVMFSSTAGVFGAMSLAHYAAANVFLDAFAQVRRAAGRPGTSVSWGTWEVIHGTAAEQQEIDRGGLRIMPVRTTLDAFMRLLRPALAHVAFAHVDWQTLKPLYEAKRPRPFFELVGNSAATESRRPAESATEMRARLLEARPAERRALLQAHIREIAAAVLGLRPTQVDAKKGLFDLGMDSLMSVDLKNRLEATLGHKLPSTLTFNYPSVVAITDFVAETILALAPTGAPATAVVPDADDELSEDELVSLLAARLEQIPS